MEPSQPLFIQQNILLLSVRLLTMVFKLVYQLLEHLPIHFRSGTGPEQRTLTIHVVIYWHIPAAVKGLNVWTSINT